MIRFGHFSQSQWPFLLHIMCLILTGCHPIDSVSAACEISVVDNGKLYDYSLASPTPDFPHGVLIEDGFYRVAANGTVLWFQLCSGMIFNHNPPTCFGCSDCGGPSHCGTQCSGLVSNDVEGYPVCTTLGHSSSAEINIADKKNPHNGVIVKMSSSDQKVDNKKVNCSLSVTVLCDRSSAHSPNTLEKSGVCDYATSLRHPSGCAKVVYIHGRGWGWFGVFILIVLCILGAYFLAGIVYRYFVLGVHGMDAIPNLEFWSNLPHRTQSFFSNQIHKFRGPSEGYRSSYSPVNF